MPPNVKFGSGQGVFILLEKQAAWVCLTSPQQILVLLVYVKAQI